MGVDVVPVSLSVNAIKNIRKTLVIRERTNPFGL